MLVDVSFDVVPVANNVWAGKYTKPLMFPEKVREGEREERIAKREERIAKKEERKKRREEKEKREERRERRGDR